METTPQPNQYSSAYQNRKHDLRDPDPWLALYLDQSIEMDEDSKAALAKNMESRSRRIFLPLIRPFARLAIIINQVGKTFLPTIFTSSTVLHWLIAFGMKRFLLPEANFLILRHFVIGSEILEFIAKNIEGVELELNPLKPTKVDDVKDHMFLNHDLNLFNFVINLNKQLKEKNIEITQAKSLDFSMISDSVLKDVKFKNSIFNFIDVQTAIEVYTPLFQIFLTNNDFWRASNSLQLDETIGIYCSKIIGIKDHLWLVNNKHPLVPKITYGAAYRLMLHGLASEALHAFLRKAKHMQAAGIEIPRA